MSSVLCHISRGNSCLPTARFDSDNAKNLCFPVAAGRDGFLKKSGAKRSRPEWLKYVSNDTSIIFVDFKEKEDLRD